MPIFPQLDTHISQLSPKDHISTLFPIPALQTTPSITSQSPCCRTVNVPYLIIIITVTQAVLYKCAVAPHHLIVHSFLS